VPGLHLLEHAGSEVSDLIWFQTGRAVEDQVLRDLERAVPRASVTRVTLRLEPEGGGAPSLGRLARRALPAARVARRALREHRAQVLLGLGGFTSLPAVLAARTLRLPVALLEVNCVPGRATRWLSRFAQRVLYSWASAVPAGDPRHAWVGPPLSRAFLELSRDDPVATEWARTAAGFRADRPLLVVLGGSQGALGLNRFVREQAGFWVEHGLQVLHQFGPGRSEEAARDLPGYRALEYLHDVPGALRAASVVLCRGGASTLAEVGVARCPAWVVPYPHHSDRHQERNARELAGGARIVDEARLDRAQAQELLALAGPGGEPQRARMRAELVGRVPSDGARRLWAELCALAVS
jgi:UDP-N-acetylglucosamine--N-acetylmuramyl-(pentapeptide) pyrophosphoryl-undecaprenol N-acetylglucosamine transferase